MNEQDIFQVRQTDVEIQEIFDQVPKNTKAIEDINGKLPEEASPENPLTDKEYVDGKVGNEANARQEAVNAERTRAEGAEQTLDGKIGANTQAIAAIQEAIKAFVNSEQVQTLINTALQPYSTTTEMNAAISAAITSALMAYYTKTATDALLANKVDKVSGKQLSTEDFTTALKTKLDALPTAADLVTQISTAISTALESYYNKTQVDNLLAPKQTAAQVSAAIATALTSYSTTTEMNAAIASALASYYTKTEIDAELQAINTAIGQKQAAITDGAQIGLGFGVSSEAATVQARTATIANFILLKNMPVSIRFTNAINVDSATLNISSTGAKPLFIQGAALQGGLVKGGCTVTVIYDGTNWNIVGIEGLERPASQSDLWVDMGLPSGRLWAVANIDVTKQSGFAEVDGKPSPFIYECTFFSWGNTEGHNLISTSAFSYNWGTSNDGPYAQTPGARLTANAGLSFDAARAILGAPWRDPSTEDFAELFANIDFVQADGETIIDASQANKLVTVNSVVGIYLKSKINSRLLFFPCSGYGYGQSWNSRGSNGRYWSRSLYSQAHGRYLHFNSGGVSPQDYSSRFYGFSRRAVQ